MSGRQWVTVHYVSELHRTRALIRPHTMIGVQLGAVIVWASLLWVMFVLGVIIAASAADVTPSGRRRMHDRVGFTRAEWWLMWAVVAAFYLIVGAAAWVFWQLGSGWWA